MRLLRSNGDGLFLQAEFTGRNIPHYANLSHTWGQDWDEITFGDIKTGLGRNKAAYAKLTFCAERAATDGLEYFWVDTCCIDKPSSTELSEAINSMFRWYRDSAKCYAFLADVPTERPASGCQRSKWFTRGWTLQELLAPKTVKFYAANGCLIGDKTTLADDIFQTTGIPREALHGGFASLSQSSVQQRLDWADGRDTKREEDAA
jgi:hypothetical protein